VLENDENEMALEAEVNAAKGSPPVQLDAPNADFDTVVALSARNAPLSEEVPDANAD
jgi:hypothetical protein